MGSPLIKLDPRLISCVLAVAMLIRGSAWGQHDIADSHERERGLDCGPLCAFLIAEAYAISSSIEALRIACGTDESGSTFLGVKRAIEGIGLRTSALRLSPDELLALNSPAIVRMELPGSEFGHFVVVWPANGDGGIVMDPPRPAERLNPETFFRHWDGIALVIEPEPPRNATTLVLIGLLGMAASYRVTRSFGHRRAS